VKSGYVPICFEEVLHRKHKAASISTRHDFAHDRKGTIS